MAYNANYYNNGARYQNPGMQQRQSCQLQSNAGCQHNKATVEARNAAHAVTMRQEQNDSNPECRKEQEPVDRMAFTMAYVPWQPWCEVYDLEEGYCRGTIFPCLDKPFKGAMFL